MNDWIDKELYPFQSNYFANAEIHEFDGFGHFVQEEMGKELCPIIERFLVKSLP